MVTYDENGFYGHPDHIQAHRITMAAVAETGIPAKVYWTTVPRSKMEEFGRLMRELGADWERAERRRRRRPPPRSACRTTRSPPGSTPPRSAAQKFDALAAHASQSENIFFLRMGEERFTEMMGIETFVRVQDTDRRAAARGRPVRRPALIRS